MTWIPGQAHSAKKFQNLSLPVDVLEEDGCFIRGFVQDIHDDGEFLVRAGWWNDTLRKVEPDRVFRPRFNEFEIAENGRPFEAGCMVEVLVRLSPRCVPRWYPGTVTAVRDDCLVDIDVGDGIIRKGLFGHITDNEDIQWPVDRTLLNYAKFYLDISDEVEISTLNDEIRVAWESATNNFVTSVDGKRSLLVVLANKEEPLPPTATFAEILAELLVFRGAKRAFEHVHCLENGTEIEPFLGCLLPVKRAKTETTPTELECEGPSAALMILEALIGIVRLLDIEDRHHLRGVCRTWKDVMEARQVCRSAHFEDVVAQLFPTVERCRYFSQRHQNHLTVIAVRCIKALDVSYCENDPFMGILAFAGPALLPQLKTLIVYEGRLPLAGLVEVMAMEAPPLIIIKNVVIRGLLLGDVPLHEIHVRIQSATVEPGWMAYTPEERAAVDQDIVDGLLDSFSRAKRGKAFYLLFHLVVNNALDVTPIGCPEESILTGVAGFREEEYLHQVRTVLKIMDPGCFKAEMDFPGAEIRLKKSSLRNATLLDLKAIMNASKGIPYRCTDPGCCS